jgi:hypothetical protein
VATDWSGGESAAGCAVTAGFGRSTTVGANAPVCSCGLPHLVQNFAPGRFSVAPQWMQVVEDKEDCS